MYDTCLTQDGIKPWSVAQQARAVVSNKGDMDVVFSICVIYILLAFVSCLRNSFSFVNIYNLVCRANIPVYIVHCQHIQSLATDNGTRCTGGFSFNIPSSFEGAVNICRNTICTAIAASSLLLPRACAKSSRSC